MSKIWLPEGKKEYQALTTKTGNQTATKIKETYTIISVSEPAFRRIFRIEKIRLYAQVTEEKLQGPWKSIKNYFFNKKTIKKIKKLLKNRATRTPPAKRRPGWQVGGGRRGAELRRGRGGGRRRNRCGPLVDRSRRPPAVTQR